MSLPLLPLAVLGSDYGDIEHFHFRIRNLLDCKEGGIKIYAIAD